MKKTGSRWIAWMAVFVLLGLAIRPDTVYGAGAIDTSENDCSITFDLSSNYQKQEGQNPEDPYYDNNNEGYPDLQIKPVTVNIYKVADVDRTGKYKEPAVNREIYKKLKTDLDKVTSGTTASAWMSMAAIAAGEVGDNSSKTTVVLNDPDSGSGNTAGDLYPGLYLIMTNEVVADDYRYTFDPYLVSLPGNNYDGTEGSSDAWVKNVTVGLKASQEHRYGDLAISKTLSSYNATLGGASFIFQIEAVMNNEKVFSDVRSISFDAAGTRTLEINGEIPSGASVTVTEVYTGASYKVTSGETRTADIKVNAPASVSFTNEYDNRLNSGTSVVNHFFTRQGSGSAGAPEGRTGQDTENTQETQNMIWDCEQLPDSVGQTGGNSDEENVG